MKKRFLSIFLALVLAVGLSTQCLASEYRSGMFIDVPVGAWYESSVAVAYELGLVDGTTSDTYSPTGNLTLAQTITLAARLHSRHINGADAFVQGNPWYQVYVDYAVNNSIIENGEFSNLSVPATRSQVAHIFAKSLPKDALVAINEVTTLPDVDENNIYCDDILLLYNAGIFTGNDEKGSFSPESNINRSEMAAILCRMAIQSERKLVSFDGDVEDASYIAPKVSDAYKATKIAEALSTIYATVTPVFIEEILIEDYLFATADVNYAIKNARIDWDIYAQIYAWMYQSEKQELGISYTEDDIRKYLINEYHFKDEQIDFAIAYIDYEYDELPRTIEPINDIEYYPAKDGSPNASAVVAAIELMKNEPTLTRYGIIEKLESSFTQTQLTYVFLLSDIDWKSYVVNQLANEFDYYQNNSYTIDDVDNLLSQYGYFYLDATEIYSLLKERVTSNSSSGQNTQAGNSGTGVTVPNEAETTGNLVWVPTNGGTKYHRYSWCSKMVDPIQVSKETAIAHGYTACGRCH